MMAKIVLTHALNLCMLKQTLMENNNAMYAIISRKLRKMKMDQRLSVLILALADISNINTHLRLAFQLTNVPFLTQISQDVCKIVYTLIFK